jgi:hypothetical protein
MVRRVLGRADPVAGGTLRADDRSGRSVERGDAMTDVGSTQLVYGIVVGLLVIGVCLVALAVFVTRRTRIDRVALAPLEVMGERRWRSRDPMTQRRLLDEARPTGAEPLRPAPDEPVLDVEFAETDRPVPSFDDLHEVALLPDGAAAAEGASVAAEAAAPGSAAVDTAVPERGASGADLVGEPDSVDSASDDAVAVAAGAEPDAAEPDAAEPDAAVPDGAVPDGAVPDAAGDDDDAVAEPLVNGAVGPSPVPAADAGDPVDAAS